MGHKCSKVVCQSDQIQPLVLRPLNCLLVLNHPIQRIHFPDCPSFEVDRKDNVDSIEEKDGANHLTIETGSCYTPIALSLGDPALNPRICNIEDTNRSFAWRSMGPNCSLLAPPSNQPR